MTAQSRINASHPHHVPVPDARTEGVRAYREPETAHPLQITFLEAADEKAWIDEIRDLLSRGKGDEADRRICAELAGFEGRIARVAKATPSAEVQLDGWEDLMPILEEWEGPAITAITLGMTNPPDLVFEPGQTVGPELLIGLYSDEAFAFSRASKAEILAECGKDMPDWVGAEEDVEFYCEAGGLAELNTALVHCKHRYFLRDGRDGVEGRAPGGYVEYVLGSWLLATRFLQAAQRVVAAKALPKGCRLVVGTVEINADFVAVLGPERAAVKSAPAQEPQVKVPVLTVKPWVPREDPTAEPAPQQAPTFRQRLGVAEPVAEEQPRRGFFARLFRRR